MTWSQTLVVSWVQFTVAAAVFLQFARMALRRLNQPADRIRLIQFSLIAVLLTPLLMSFAPLPRWSLPWVAPIAGGQPGPTVAAIYAEPETSPVVSAREGPSDALRNEADWQSPLERRHESSSAHGDSPVGSSTTPGNSSAPSVHQPPGGFDVWTAAAVTICAAHTLAALYFLIEWGMGACSLRTLCRAASPVNQAVGRAWAEVTRKRGPHVRLLSSPTVDAPLMYGNLRPTVVLPREMAEAGGAALGFCLAHEWSHIERHDMLAWNFVRGCQCLLWLQPAYWTLRAELRLQQDILADDRATQARVDAIEYSELLIGFARNRMSAPVAGALTLIDRPTQLMKRIKMLLENPLRLRSRPSRTVSCSVAGVALLFALAISCIRVEATRANNAAKADSATPDAKRASDKPTSTDRSAETAATSNATTHSRKRGSTTYKCRVVDQETHQGIPRVKVHIQWRDLALNDTEFRIAHEAQLATDANGEYVIDVPDVKVVEDNLDLVVQFEHADYAKTGKNNTLKGIWDREQRGNRTGLEIAEMRRAEAVTGTIVAPDGQPISGVEVSNYGASVDNAVSDREGKFRIAFATNSDAILWISPKNFSIVERFLEKKRGDLGTITLDPGIRVSGRVMGVNGKPIPNIPVNIRLSGVTVFGGQSKVHRGAITDTEGRYAFDPLPAGEYDIYPDEVVEDPLRQDIGRRHYPLPAVFSRKKLTLKGGQGPVNFDIQALPSVMFNAQIVDSAGGKVDGGDFRRFAGHLASIGGAIDGTNWFAWARPDQSGKFAIRTPHGLQRFDFQILTSPHSEFVYRIRTSRKEKLLPIARSLQLGEIYDDVEGIEIVRYKPGVVVVSTVDEEGKPINAERLSSAYANGSQLYVAAGEVRSDVQFERLPEGRLRSFLMYPNEAVRLEAIMSGYESTSETITVPEGQTREIVLKLKKRRDEGKPAVKGGAK